MPSCCARDTADDGETSLHARLTGVIHERPTCVSCLTARTESIEAAIAIALQRISRTLRLVVARGERCRACGRTDQAVFSVSSSD